MLVADEGIKQIIQDQTDLGETLKDRGWARVKDLKNGKAIVIWNELSPELKKQGYFKVKTGNKEIILNKHELTYLLRNV